MAPVQNTTNKIQIPNTNIHGANSIKTVSKSKKTPAPTPTQLSTHANSLAQLKLTLNDTLARINQIMSNASSTFGATKQIARAASEQSKADRAEGKGILSGLSDFTKIVQEMTDLISTRASARGVTQSQQKQLTINDLGEIAKDYTNYSINSDLIEGAASSLGVSTDALADRSTIDLILDNFGLSSASDEMLANQISGGAAGQVGDAVGDLAGASSAMPLSAKILGGLGAAYSAFQVFSNWGKSDPISGAVNGFTAGAYIGSYFSPLGTAIGGVIGGIVGLASGLFKSGKSEIQRARDQVRAMMIQNGMINDKWQLTLANGDLYDIGKDGGFKLTNTDGTTRHAYDVDFTNPLAAETVGMLQPLAFMLTGGNPKLASDFTGYFTNAALSNATTIEEARSNALAIVKATKIQPEKMIQSIAALVEQGALDEATGKAYLNGFLSIFSGNQQTTGALPEQHAKSKKAA